MEAWLHPKKREVKARDPAKTRTTAEKMAERRAEKAAWQAAREVSAEGETGAETVKPVVKVKKSVKNVPPTPSISDQVTELDDDEEDDADMPDLTDGEEVSSQKSKTKIATRPAAKRRQSGRGAKKAITTYAEGMVRTKPCDNDVQYRRGEWIVWDVGIL
jgi:hypothetical protein